MANTSKKHPSKFSRVPSNNFTSVPSLAQSCQVVAVDLQEYSRGNDAGFSASPQGFWKA